MSTPERLDHMLARAEWRKAFLVRRAQVVKDFYAQLSPAQQQVFDNQARLWRAGRGGPHRQCNFVTSRAQS